MADMDERIFVTPIKYFRRIRQQKSAYTSDPLSICPWLILQLIFHFFKEGAYQCR